jgi:hypothetical protein
VRKYFLGKMYKHMNCFQYQIQSSMPSLFGSPTDDDVRTCSKYAWNESGSLRFCSQFDTDCQNLYSEADWSQWTSGANSRTLASTMMGTNDIHLRAPTVDEEAGMYLLGLSFLPWNKSEFVRVHTTGNIIIPVNPWHKEVLVSNGLTAAKLTMAGVTGFFVVKLVTKKLAQRI